MAPKFHKLNYKYGIVEYPLTLKEFDEIILEFPKTERKFYEIAIKALKKDVAEHEQILFLTSADPKLTKFGFMVITEKKLIFVTMKTGIFAGAETEIIEYSKIKEVDFDIAPNPMGLAQMELGMIYLKIKGGLGTKKRTIRNINKHSVEDIVKILREKIN